MLQPLLERQRASLLSIQNQKANRGHVMRLKVSRRYYMRNLGAIEATLR